MEERGYFNRFACTDASRCHHIWGDESIHVLLCREGSFLMGNLYPTFKVELENNCYAKA